MRSARKPALGLLLGFLLAAFCAPLAAAGENSNLSPVGIVRRAVNNEVAADQQGGGIHFMFKDLKKTPQSSQTKLVVETREATAGLLVMQNGRPLTPQERQTEDARLSAYVQNPQELRSKQKQEKADADHSERILRALPDAFLYQRDGTQPSREGLGAPGDDLIQLNFRPNPKYNPPTHVEQVLTGMHGHLLIDVNQDRIAEIDGTLQSEVGFGWGILGHLDPGGRFLVQQADVGDHHWEVTHMELSFTGKILFVKKLSIHSSDVFTDFHPVPDLTFAQGVELLKKKAAEIRAAEGTPQTGNKNAQNENNKTAREQAEKAPCCDP
ncbi:MAG TPA: hypothetical protein VLW06_06295 [Terriglobales bacterium]|nr:hypothetical protein [Terriglobales bacterium]